MRTYKLYGSDGGSATNNLANVTVQKNGRIRNLRWSMYSTGQADGERAMAELSMSSTQQTSTNDTPNVIDQVSCHMVLTTSGAINTGTNISRENMDFPVAAGEKIYLHTVGTSNLVTVPTVFVDVEEM